MELKIVLHNVFDETDTEYTFTGSDESTMQDVLDYIGNPIPDFEVYYPLCYQWFLNSDYALPFVFKNNRMVYDALFSETRVTTFLKTHCIENGTIQINTGYPQAGGVDFDLVLLWDYLSPFLNNLASSTLSAFVCAGIKAVFDKFKKEKIPPQVFIDAVFSRQKWNPFELAEYLGVGITEAKNLLQMYQYEYDKTQRVYVQSQKTEQVRKELNENMGKGIES